MTVDVKKTTFETDAVKKLIVVDVYNEPEPNKPVNNEINTPGPLSNAGLEGFIPNQVTSLSKDLNKKPDFTLLDAVSLFTGVVDDPSSFRESVGDTVMNNVLGSMGYSGTIDDVIKSYSDPINLRTVLQSAGESNAELKVIIDGVTSTIDGADLKSVNGISQVIGGLTGNTDLVKILNLGPSLSIVNEFLGEAMRLELPGAVDALIDSLDDDESKRKLKLHGTWQAANFADLDFLEKQIDSPDVGAGAIVSLTPDIISLVLQNYKLYGKSPTTEDAQKLLRILNKLDNKWMKYQRGEDYIDNLSYLTEASDDAIRVLLKDPSTYVAALISGQLETNNMIEYTLNMRPYTPASILR